MVSTESWPGGKHGVVGDVGDVGDVRDVGENLGVIGENLGDVITSRNSI